MDLFSNIIKDNKFTPESIPPFEEKLFFEGAKRRVNVERFAVLLWLSTIIATYGVLGDSTATVIGAMIIAPLMTPIMATAAGLVMGDMRRAGRSFLTVVGGVAGVILTAWFIGRFLNTTVISFANNSQIVGRVSPNLTDLAVALASGAAGAFAMSREDVADSLPGVAISIALVPPLAVVGIALSSGQWGNAYGAMLLFITNFFSILLAGGGTLALLGLSAASTKGLKSEARRKAFIYIAVGTILVAFPLASTSFKVAQDTLTELQTQQFMQQWLAGTDYETTRVRADGRSIEIVVNGSGAPPPMPASDAEIPSGLAGYELELRIMPSEVLHYPEPEPEEE